MKTVLVFHSFSAHGHMAVNVLLPILKTGGLDPTYVPTTLLSAHTAYVQPVIEPQDDFVRSSLAHFETLGLSFDALMSGYCFSVDLIGEIEHYFQQHPTSFKVVDPVLGDHGQLYTGLTSDHVQAFQKLIQSADLITPNVTEALLLANVPVQNEPYLSSEQLATLVDNLSALTKAMIVVKGVVVEENFLTNLIIKDGAILNQFSHIRRPQQYYGSGDLFVSLLTVHLLGGMDLETAVKRCGELLLEALDDSVNNPENLKKGIEIHSILPKIYFPKNEER